MPALCATTASFVIRQLINRLGLGRLVNLETLNTFGDLERRLVAGVSWSMVPQVLSRALLLVVGVALPRMLGQADYGRYALVATFVPAAAVLG